MSQKSKFEDFNFALKIFLIQQHPLKKRKYFFIFLQAGDFNGITVGL